MSDDLFGPVPAVEAPATIANSGNSGSRRKGAKPKAAAKPVPRMVAPAPPAAPKVYEPIPMGRGGKPAAEQPPEEPPMPRFKRARLSALEACDCCDRPSSCDEEFLIQREHHRDEVVRACETCRASGGDDFPRVAWMAGDLAAPLVIGLLREANRLPYEPRRGHL